MVELILASSDAYPPRSLLHIVIPLICLPAEVSCSLLGNIVSPFYCTNPYPLTAATKNQHFDTKKKKKKN